MRRIAGVVLLLSLSLLATGAEGGGSRTISWHNPTTYEDGGEIPAVLRAIIETRLYFSLDRVSWTPFATVSAGEESWTGMLPVEEGIPAYYAVTTTIPPEGRESELSLSVSFTEPVTDGSSFPTHIFRASFVPTEDTYVGGGNDRHHFNEPSIGTYTWPANVIANRGFLRWDLSAISPDASIISATLWLFYVSEEWEGRDDEYTVSVSKVVGVQPDLGVATWNTYDGVSPWTGGSDGGEENLAPAESSATIGKRHRWVAWDVSEMVGERVASMEPNLVMALDADSIATEDSNRFFASLEHPDPALRPRLEVVFRRSSSTGILAAEQGVRVPEEGGSGVPFPSGPSVPGFLASMGPVEDTWVNGEIYQDRNFSSHPKIRTYTWPAGSVGNRGFLLWDLSLLPPNALVTGATLALYSDKERAWGNDLYWVGVSKVTGVDLDLSHLTWNTCDGTHPWTGGADGGSANLSPPESVSAVGMEGGWTLWNVTQMVREAAGSAGKVLVTAVDGDPYALEDARRYFFSKDYYDRTVHPRLNVTYTIKP